MLVQEVKLRLNNAFLKSRNVMVYKLFGHRNPQYTFCNAFIQLKRIKACNFFWQCILNICPIHVPKTVGQCCSSNNTIAANKHLSLQWPSHPLCAQENHQGTKWLKNHSKTNWNTVELMHTPSRNSLIN